MPAPTPREIFTLVLLSGSTGLGGAGLLATSERLITGPFPLGTELYTTYFAYAGSAVVFAHGAAFLLNHLLIERRSSIRKKIPKFFEYAYVCVLSVSLAQIFFSSARLADYLFFLTGHEEQAWTDVRSLAQDHVAKDCGQTRTKFFTEPYCGEMLRIAKAENVKTYVFDNVVSNEKFLSHVIRIDSQSTAKGGKMYYEIKSPISYAIRRLHARDVYAKMPPETVSNNIFGWIAILLIPIGIALRLVKTSLELFGDLDKS